MNTDGAERLAGACTADDELRPLNETKRWGKKKKDGRKGPNVAGGSRHPSMQLNAHSPGAEDKETVNANVSPNLKKQNNKLPIKYHRFKQMIDLNQSNHTIFDLPD